MSTPHDQPYTFVTGSEGAGQPAFTGDGCDWRPSSPPTDPHSESYDVIGERIEPVEGPVAPTL
jgi:hypothetical protein